MPGMGSDAALLGRVAAVVEDSLDLQPGVVDTEAGRPDHGPHVHLGEVEFEDRVAHALGDRAELRASGSGRKTRSISTY